MLKSLDRGRTLPSTSGLTERETTSNFISVLTNRFLIVSLILFFSLFAFLAAFAACLGETDVTADSARQLPSSISCLDSAAHPFLSTLPYPGKKSASSPKIGERAVNDYRVALLHEGYFYSTSLRCSAPALASLSVPIYQLKAVYLI